MGIDTGGVRFARPPANGLNPVRGKKSGGRFRVRANAVSSFGFHPDRDLKKLAGG